MSKAANCVFNPEKNTIDCHGTWSILNTQALFSQFKNLNLPQEKVVTLNGQQIDYLDSAAALMLIDQVSHYEKKGIPIKLTGFSANHKALLNLVKSKKISPQTVQMSPTPPLLYRVGVESVNKLKQIDGFTKLLGELFLTFLLAFRRVKRFQGASILANIDTAGLKALPILALLSFLIGVVLAYQMGIQLQTYGANIFIAYLSGLAIFREFAPLITAIIVAGRTSSAFTAQIGSMQINEEIDALLTMGISPVQRLVMPKVLGLLIVFPLLIFWADIFSLMGAMFMSKWMLSVSYYDFLMRLKESVGLKQLMLGIYKAPTFAIVIALVGCFQGFRVEANADSIGSQTTKSVVQALFLIIIVDAWYSIIYSWMNL